MTFQNQRDNGRTSRTPDSDPSVTANYSSPALPARNPIENGTITRNLTAHSGSRRSGHRGLNSPLRSIASLAKALFSNPGIQTAAGIHLALWRSLGFSAEGCAAAGAVAALAAYSELNNLKLGEPIKNWLAKMREGYSNNLKLTPPFLISNGLRCLNLANSPAWQWPLQIPCGVCLLGVGMGAEIVRGSLAVATTLTQLISKPIRYSLEQIAGIFKTSKAS